MMQNGSLKSTPKENEDVEASSLGSNSGCVGVTCKYRENTIYLSTKQFANGVKLYIEKPHVINKKICGFKLKWIGLQKSSVHKENLCKDLQLLLQNSSEKDENSFIVSITKILQVYGFAKSMVEIENPEIVPWSSISALTEENGSVILVRVVIPKKTDLKDFLAEVIVIENGYENVTFVSEVSSLLPKVLPEFTYGMGLKEGKINLTTLPGVDDGPSYKWVKCQLIPTLTKWATQMKDDFVNVASSIRLINTQLYYKTYQDLKRKYAQYLKEIWTETTDPLKFIHEDLAIASYLIVLWEQERTQKQLNEKQSFLDLGCGNGLLVFLLSSEGHPGMGIDIKSRKLWTKFPRHVQLKETVILPSDKHLYPNYDWLIGNHSDELTPWLPVIAAKSSFSSRFFVIPCCAFDFHSKYRRRRAGVSQYSEYLDYIEEIGSRCGFAMWKDKLRIPSTKRTCLIGQNRVYKPEELSEKLLDISEFIKSRESGISGYSFITEEDNKETEKIPEGEKLWVKEFKPREEVQKTKNCTQIKQEVKDELVNDIAFLLLAKESFVQIKRGDEEILWNRGGEVPMGKLAQVLASHLKHLKNECGGLQTFLRNHKFVFKIERGNVLLRVPQSSLERCVSDQLLKTKSCWFHFHHPQGCVLKKEDCTYFH